MYPFSKKNKSLTPTSKRAAAVVDVDQALDEAKGTLWALDAEGFLRERSLAFAQSLMATLGENPETPQNQLLIHQMAIENLRSRAAILNGPPARK
jgi:hypothetical protein